MHARRVLIMVGGGGLLVLLLAAVFSSVAGEAPADDPVLDGVWAMVVPTPGGIIRSSWAAVRQDPNGTRYTTTVHAVKPAPTLFGMFPEAAVQTTHVGPTVQTDDGAYETTNIGYGVAAPAAPGMLGEIVYISVLTSTSRFTGPDSIEGEGMHAFYLPFADGDGDGLPDPGQEPVFCFPYASTGTRIPMMAPCEPIPGYPVVGMGSSTGVSETEFEGTATLYVGEDVLEATVAVTATEIVVDDDGTQHVTATHTFTLADGTSFTTTDEETAVPTETPGLYSIAATMLITEGDYGGRLQAVGTMDFAAEPPQAQYKLYGMIYPLEE